MNTLRHIVKETKLKSFYLKNLLQEKVDLENLFIEVHYTGS